MCTAIIAVIKAEIAPHRSLVFRYDVIEMFSPCKKLFVCIYIDRPENETENEITASFILFDTNVRAEILFVALLISKNGSIKL